MKIREQVLAALVLGALTVLPVAANSGAAPSASASSDAQSTSSGFNSINQYAITPGSQPMHSKVDKFGGTCPTAQARLYGGMQDTDYHGLGHRVNNKHFGTSITTPIPGKQMRTCIQGQRAALKIMEWEAVDAERATDNEIIKHCISAAREGIWLDPEVFAWAHKCDGVVQATARSMAKLEDENASLKARLAEQQKFVDAGLAK